ncbi:uncharacterized protein G2W53_000747 [Senna tora]|uniref:Reverse transcriptase zinc-binding domain-containing protein n=1 Tax=Senna tora TaxID=362788 RepID=A0A835CLY2_9FABA|nr:uncharacterized protein G2W53_000747 [Senna tora]
MDRWIPWVSEITNDNMVGGSLAVNYVCELLNEEGTGWNVAVISSIFRENMCNRIQKIPINHRQGEDRWSWVPDLKGVFTVKSCYKVAMAERWPGINITPGTLITVEEKFWKRIWKLPLMPKYKVFIWRVCLDILPTAGALSGRGVNIDAVCSLCGSDEESTFHALLECPRLDSVWQGAPFDLHNRIYHNSVLEWIVVEGLSWSNEQLCMTIILVYLLWNDRNAVVLEGKDQAVANCWVQVARRWEEMKDAKTLEDETVMDVGIYIGGGR